ncbi:MAG: glycosyl hydrolase 53 family protein [Bacteroidales bacterium]|nr:glycosyl hydrolase 53 family protein [Bacteroidales bacterium]
MKFLNKLLNSGACIAAVTLAACCSCTDTPLPHTPAENPESVTCDRTAFAKGADISWVTEMESKGMKFYNSKGEERECTALMKEIGMNSIRLRVWVDPADGWNSAADVLVKAMRAQKLGMRIMIDFHYSDTWADPGHQAPPAAWADYDIDGLVKAVYDHTSDILSLLKKYGVEVEWVQVGNETRTGMMWPLGSYNENGGKNYTALTNSGYDAVKSVYPDAKVIVHLDGGHDNSLYTRLFSVLKANGGRYDMIGMSLYPCWWNDEKKDFDTDWKPNTDACIANIQKVYKAYGKDVIICETGMPVSHPDKAREMLAYLLEKTKALECCKGVFYWEPQAPDGYNDGYGLGAFRDGKPTAALEPFME